MERKQKQEEEEEKNIQNSKRVWNWFEMEKPKQDFGKEEAKRGTEKNENKILTSLFETIEVKSRFVFGLSSGGSKLF